MEEDWSKRLSDHQLQEAQKKTDRAITLVAEAVHVPAHLVRPGSPPAKELCHLHIQLSLGQSCHRQKKSCIYARSVTLIVSKSLQPCRLWQAKQLCHLHAPLSLGQSCHRPKRISRLYMQGSLQSCPTICSPVDCGLPGFSVRGFLQARLECIGQYWLSYPSRALYFLLP